MGLTFKVYEYNNPSGLPVNWEDSEPGEHEWDDVCTAAGFDPSDEELGIGRLTEAWMGHPAGAMVLSGLLVEGHPFAVSFEVA